MSVHVEWTTADGPVRLMRPGQKMANGQCAEGWALAIGDGLGALVVVEGAPDQLVGFAQRVVSAISLLDVSSPRHTRAGDRPWRLTTKGLMATTSPDNQPAA